MKQFVILLVLTIWGALLVACSHDIRENGLENVTYNVVQDVDGNYYDAVQIGEQVWMRTNLRTKHFRDGSQIYDGSQINNGIQINIDYVLDHIAHWASPAPLCAEFGDNNGSFWNNYEKKTYGLLYNWCAVDDQRGLCPEGWHVPSDAEWDQLVEYVENQWGYNDYSVAKALASQYGWCRRSDYVGAPGCCPEENNASGFGAVPAGYRDPSFDYGGYCARFWSSTHFSGSAANFRSMSFDHAGVGRNYSFVYSFYSVRCLRD